MNDYREHRCGHNFPPADCKADMCGYRDALATIATLERELERLAGELARAQIVPGSVIVPPLVRDKWQALVQPHIDAIRRADGQTDAPRP